MRLLFVILLGFSLNACMGILGGDRSGFPDLFDVPDRRETTLTPERREEVTEELNEARDEAVAHAAEGRGISDTSEDDDIAGEQSEDPSVDNGEEE